MNRVLYIVKLVVVLVVSITIFSFVTISHNDSLCQSVEISINDNLKYYTQEEILKILQDQKINILETKIKDININKIESIISSMHYVKKANVYLTIDGILRIDIEHRKPIVRIINSNYENFLIDDNGAILYTSENFTPRVIYANGFIKKNYANYASKNIIVDKDKKSLMQNNIISDIYTVCKYIDNDSLWSRMIEQIYINEQNEIELIPKIGNQVIILGNVENLENKFRKLLAFYQHGIIYMGWDKYSVINLKYKNQVVCN
ncbi:MAG: hypothetical protein A2X12_00835 [Bacteroidetes bacterium GWE2_29_8]|nr:MAG: hypothetical protein A2X12_00835 [Bacteroidetes bacterium GWE2_29_8]OFY15624.1 MAG: hypothetical protein A2X02_06305 [Bacteroidetes bacterium GWF2_29_10]